jgi:hypothetical protein
MAATARKKPATTPDEVEVAAAVVQDLEQRLIQAQAAVDGFALARAQHSFAASQGDADAQSALNILTTEQRAAEHIVADLTEALAEARRRLEVAKADAAVSDDQAGLDAAKVVAAEYVAAAEAVDQALIALRASVDRYHALAARLERTRTLPQTVAMQMASDAALNFAVQRENCHRIYTWDAHSAVGGTGQRLGDFARGVARHLDLPSKIAKLRRIF